MQKIEAYIRPNRLEQVRKALEGANITGISITDIDGFGDLKGRADQMFRGQEYTVAFRRIIKLELFCYDDRVADIVKAISDAARTGELGDGKIFVHSIDLAYRIRTGETDDEAI
jgi:nitrogen regulatory protein PII